MRNAWAAAGSTPSAVRDHMPYPDPEPPEPIQTPPQAAMMLKASIPGT